MEETFEKYFNIGVGGNYVYDFETKSIWVNGDVSFKKTPKLGIKYLTKLPVPFGEVNGQFKIDDVPNLETLEGFPKKCRYFVFVGNKIKTLKYSPVETDVFHFHSDNLESLEGMPSKARLVALGDVTMIKKLIIPNNCEQFTFTHNDKLKDSDIYKRFLIKRELL